MYRFITPGIAQLAGSQMDAIGGHVVHPLAKDVTAPFLMERVLKSSGGIPKAINIYGT